MKRTIYTIMAIFAAAIMLPAMAETNDEIEALKARIAALEAEQVETYDNVSRLVRSEVVALQDEMAFAAMDDAGVISLAKADTLKIYGDLRLRWEINEGEVDDPSGADDEMSDDRGRYRFRLGMTWQNECWEVGTRLTTNLFGEDSRNVDAAWNGWGTYSVGFDLMYAKHTWEMEDWEVALTLGKMKNPFVSSFLFWDSDITPEGAALTGEMGMLYGVVGAFETWDPGTNDQANNALYAAQLGVKDELDTFAYNIAAAYYWYNSPNTNSDFSGRLAGVGSPDYDFEIGQLYGELTTEMDAFELGLFGEVFKNFGADGDFGDGQALSSEKPDDNDMGWIIGLTGAWERWSAMYAYGHIESDAQVAGFADSDFTNYDAGGGTKGHEFTIAYEAMTNMTVGFDVIMVEAIEENPNAADDDWEGTTYQFDLVYKF